MDLSLRNLIACKIWVLLGMFVNKIITILGFNWWKMRNNQALCGIILSRILRMGLFCLLVFDLKRKKDLFCKKINLKKIK